MLRECTYKGVYSFNDIFSLIELQKLERGNGARDVPRDLYANKSVPCSSFHSLILFLFKIVLIWAVCLFGGGILPPPPSLFFFCFFCFLLSSCIVNADKQDKYK